MATVAPFDSPQVILRRHNLHPKHSWGQNFLGDPRVLERIADALDLQPGEPVVELGPGLGHLTRFLLATGAQVTAIERDRDMVQVLEAELPHPALHVVAANAADGHYAEQARAPRIAIAGNLPYHLTSSILFRVLEEQATVSRAVFTVQKEVAARLTAPPGGREYGLLSVLLGRFFVLESLFVLGARQFHPPPKVDSAVIRLTALPAPRGDVHDEAHFIQVVKAAFAHRRKTLLNSLRSNAALGDVETLRRALERAQIDPGVRAETLAPEAFAALERALAAEISPLGGAS